MRSTLALVALAVAGCAKPTPPAGDLGALSKPQVVTGRDGGASVLVGDRVLWLFGDTLMTAVGVDGFQYRSATAAWGAPGALQLDEALDANQTPLQLFPYTDAERAYNVANGPTERFALWPGSAIAAPDGSGAWIFYQLLKVHPQALDYTFLGVGIARLAAGSTVATRDPQLLFAAPLPSFALGAVVDSGFVHVYGCDPVPGALDQVCRVVRAPTASATDASAWTAWDGATWNADLTRAAVVLHGAPGDLSVSYNAAIGRFVAVYSGIFENTIYVRQAPRPEGPWSEARALCATIPPPSGSDYAGKEHPELAAGARVVVSYAHPLGGFDGEVRLATATLP